MTLLTLLQYDADQVRVQVPAVDDNDRLVQLWQRVESLESELGEATETLTFLQEGVFPLLSDMRRRVQDCRQLLDKIDEVWERVEPVVRSLVEEVATPMGGMLPARLTLPQLVLLRRTFGDLDEVLDDIATNLRTG